MYIGQLNKRQEFVDAIKSHNISKIRILLKNGMNPNIRMDESQFEITDFKTWSSFFHPLPKNSLPTALEWLLDEESPSSETIVLLINSGADVKVENSKGESLLDSAVKHGNPETASFYNVLNTLLIHGCNSRKESGSDYILSVGVEWNDPKIVEIAMINGANADKAHELSIACDIGLPDVVSVILKYHANPNQVNKAGNPPIFTSIRAVYDDERTYGKNTKEIKLTIVSALLQAGADINYKDPKGRTAIDEAVRKKMFFLLPILREYKRKRDQYSH